jgi:hypothetical protein
MSYWAVAVPNEGKRSSDTTFNELKAETASSKNDLAGRFIIEIHNVREWRGVSVVVLLTWLFRRLLPF